MTDRDPLKLQHVWDRLAREDAEEQARRDARNIIEGPVRLIGFSMSDEESRRYKRWYDKHHEECWYINYELAEKLDKPHSATGGGIKFSFSPCSIGTNVTVTCVCGAKVDCTDYDGW